MNSNERATDRLTPFAPPNLRGPAHLIHRAGDPFTRMQPVESRRAPWWYWPVVVTLFAAFWWLA